MATQQVEHAEEEHEGLNPRQYIMIGLLLTVITVVELVASYSELGDALIPILVILSAVKFVIVVAFYMHLKFEARLFTMMFVGPLILAGLVLIALVALFWNDASSIV